MGCSDHSINQQGYSFLTYEMVFSFYMVKNIKENNLQLPSRILPIIIKTLMCILGQDHPLAADAEKN